MRRSQEKKATKSITATDAEWTVNQEERWWGVETYNIKVLRLLHGPDLRL